MEKKIARVWLRHIRRFLVFLRSFPLWSSFCLYWQAYIQTAKECLCQFVSAKLFGMHLQKSTLCCMSAGVRLFSVCCSAKLLVIHSQKSTLWCMSAGVHSGAEFDNRLVASSTQYTALWRMPMHDMQARNGLCHSVEILKMMTCFPLPDLLLIPVLMMQVSALYHFHMCHRLCCPPPVFFPLLHWPEVDYGTAY